MLSIRKNQLSIMQSVSRKGFVDPLSRRLVSIFPERFCEMSTLWEIGVRVNICWAIYNCVVTIWNTNDRQARDMLADHEGPVMAARFTTDGSLWFR